jgi:hypothetical protein
MVVINSTMASQDHQSAMASQDHHQSATTPHQPFATYLYNLNMLAEVSASILQEPSSVSNTNLFKTNFLQAHTTPNFQNHSPRVIPTPLNLLYINLLYIGFWLHT